MGPLVLISMHMSFFQVHDSIQALGWDELSLFQDDPGHGTSK